MYNVNIVGNNIILFGKGTGILIVFSLPFFLLACSLPEKIIIKYNQKIAHFLWVDYTQLPNTKIPEPYYKEHINIAGFFFYDILNYKEILKSSQPDTLPKNLIKWTNIGNYFRILSWPGWEISSTALYFKSYIRPPLIT